MKPEGWDVPFETPIPLPGGGTLETLRDAGRYIEKLPARDQKRPEWQAAIDDLLKAATVDRAWRFFARRSVYVAIHGEGDRLAIPAPRAGKQEVWRERRRAAKAGKR